MGIWRMTVKFDLRELLRFANCMLVAQRTIGSRRHGIWLCRRSIWHIIDQGAYETNSSPSPPSIHNIQMVLRNFDLWRLFKTKVCDRILANEYYTGISSNESHLFPPGWHFFLATCNSTGKSTGY